MSDENSMVSLAKHLFIAISLQNWGCKIEVSLDVFFAADSKKTVASLYGFVMNCSSEVQATENSNYYYTQTSNWNYHLLLCTNLQLKQPIISTIRKLPNETTNYFYVYRNFQLKQRIIFKYTETSNWTTIYYFTELSNWNYKLYKRVTRSDKKPVLLVWMTSWRRQETSSENKRSFRARSQHLGLSILGPLHRISKGRNASVWHWCSIDYPQILFLFEVT